MSTSNKHKDDGIWLFFAGSMLGACISGLIFFVALGQYHRNNQNIIENTTIAVIRYHQITDEYPLVLKENPSTGEQLWYCENDFISVLNDTKSDRNKTGNYFRKLQGSTTHGDQN